MKQKQDFFTALDGRVKFIRGNYNITADPIFLAAFVNVEKRDVIPGRLGPVKRGRANPGPLQVLDVGVGTGGAAIALLTRVPDAKITGIDISAEMIDECTENGIIFQFIYFIRIQFERLPECR